MPHYLSIIYIYIYTYIHIHVHIHIHDEWRVRFPAIACTKNDFGKLPCSPSGRGSTPGSISSIILSKIYPNEHSTMTKENINEKLWRATWMTTASHPSHPSHPSRPWNLDDSDDSRWKWVASTVTDTSDTGHTMWYPKVQKISAGKKGSCQAWTDSYLQSRGEMHVGLLHPSTTFILICISLPICIQDTNVIHQTLGHFMRDFNICHVHQRIGDSIES